MPWSSGSFWNISLVNKFVIGCYLLISLQWNILYSKSNQCATRYLQHPNHLATTPYFSNSFPRTPFWMVDGPQASWWVIKRYIDLKPPCSQVCYLLQSSLLSPLSCFSISLAIFPTSPHTFNKTWSSSVRVMMCLSNTLLLASLTIVSHQRWWLWSDGNLDI